MVSPGDTFSDYDLSGWWKDFLFPKEGIQFGSSHQTRIYLKYLKQNHTQSKRTHMGDMARFTRHWFDASRSGREGESVRIGDRTRTRISTLPSSCRRPAGA